MTEGTRTGRAVPGNRWDLLDGVRPDVAPTVSVIVAHYRQPEQLARLLHALGRQDFPADRVEIIVVDDGSPEPPVVPRGVRLLVQADAGFRLAAARNLGAAAARNEILVFLDADTTPEPEYLRQITRLPALAFDSVTVGRRKHADLALVPTTSPIEIAGPRHELEDPSWLVDAYRESRNLLDLNCRSYRYLIGAVLACSRRFFLETGGFDDSFDQYGGEDWEWGYRAWLLGAVIAHVPEAVAWHDGADRAGREPGALSSKNAETLRLIDLIPVPGSRGRGLPANRVDILVSGPKADATEAQAFVSVDSALAALPRHSATIATVGAAPLIPPDPERFDRVRLEFVLERPVRIHPGALATVLTAVESGDYQEVLVRDANGTLLLRARSRREAARQRRWGPDAVLPTLELGDLPGITELVAEVDLEAYLGGW
ncbi:glycosyltransferase family 2 protein [Cryobacterium arcticum]|uniref:Glycosyltransferase n=1 Tax=Cryobacterium arcticum TaxID=670052 RepID=A0A318A4Y7_9MICO|nr:glycosyltransferase [Cryobacterium arcticum]PXA72397.1 glycosyltransferase [Cryobacterium arcticum]